MSKGPGRDKYESYTKPITNNASTPNSGNSKPKTDCDNVEFETQLVRPQQSALAKVREGDVLSVRVPSVIARIEVLNRDNEVCGNVSASNLSQLINCIEKGQILKAAVKHLIGDSCIVLLYSLKK